MSLDLFQTAQRDAQEFARQRPVVGLDPGLAMAFTTAHEEAQNVSQSTAEYAHRWEFVQQSLDKLEDVTGESYANPEAQDPTNRAVMYDFLRKHIAEAADKHPDAGLSFPSEDEIQRFAVQKAQGFAAREAQVQARSQSWGSTIGTALGGIVGAAEDPINIATMMFGAGASAGILRTALREGALAAGSQTTIEASTYGFRQQVDPSFGPAQAATEIGEAGVGGAALGGGLKGLSRAWEAARGRWWPDDVKAAAGAVQRAATVPASPFPGPAGDALHRSTIEAASADVARGRPTQLPAELPVRQAARPGRVFDAENRSIGVEYQVAEADSLITSHRDDLSVNPAFPPELQPRDRTRAISQDQITNISGHLAPERLGPSPSADSGAPIVGPDGLVESGNARVLAIRRAYQQDQSHAEAYRNFLREQGFDVGAYDKPVLIARRVEALSPEDRIAFTTAANRASSLQLSATERGLADARLLDSGLLSRLQPGEVTSAGNREFVRGFLDKLPTGERGAVVDAGGALSQDGERRITAALMGRAYGDPQFLGRAIEDADSNIKALAGSLADAAGPWAGIKDAVARGRIPAGMDITAHLLDAIRTVMHARDQGVPVKMLANQGEMFGGPSDLSKILLGAMFGTDFGRPVARAKFAEFLSDYADEALKNTTDARLLGEPLSPEEVLRGALRKAGRADLAAQVADRTTPEAAAKLLDSPELAEATIMEAERHLLGDTPKMIRVAETDAAGNDVMVEHSLDDLFAKEDAEIAAAGEIENCALGKDATE